LKKLKILVLDCNPIIHIGLKSIFKNSMIFEVCAYLDNKDLLIETISEEKIDLIISEINLNGSSAMDILKILKKIKLIFQLLFLLLFQMKSNR
jgi:DNA-binding NarL/FixJ family response regulator